MSLFQPSQLRQFLESLGIQPNKHLSQNFLVDGNILRKIIEAGNLKENDLVVEIGPGPGVLTEGLLNAGVRVLAIEKDKVFANALTRLQTSDQRLTVACEDFLKFPLETTLSKLLASGHKAHVISNLPYHLTAPILGILLPLNHLIDNVIVMVQKEVAERMVAKEGSKIYGSFSIFTQFYSKATLLFPVSPHCFYPKPKVTSAIVKCHLAPPEKDIVPELFLEFTKTLFCNRRKMITTCLKEKFENKHTLESLHKLHINEKSRPEDLSLQQLLSLFRLLYNIS